MIFILLNRKNGLQTKWQFSDSISRQIEYHIGQHLRN